MKLRAKTLHLCNVVRILDAVNEQMRWSTYIDATSGGAKNSEIARRVGVDPATVGRWRTGMTDPNPRQVVAYARAFDRPSVEALIAAGYITAEEAGVPVSDAPADPLAGVSTRNLLAEALRRVDAANVAGADDDDFEFSPNPPKAHEYRLAARKGTRK